MALTLNLAREYRDLVEAVRRGDPETIARKAVELARRRGEYLRLETDDIMYAFASENVARIVTRYGVVITFRKSERDYYILVETLGRE